MKLWGKLTYAVLGRANYAHAQNAQQSMFKKHYSFQAIYDHCFLITICFKHQQGKYCSITQGQWNPGPRILSGPVPPCCAQPWGNADESHVAQKWAIFIQSGGYVMHFSEHKVHPRNTKNPFNIRGIALYSSPRLGVVFCKQFSLLRGRKEETVILNSSYVPECNKQLQQANKL